MNSHAAATSLDQAAHISGSGDGINQIARAVARAWPTEGQTSDASQPISPVEAALGQIDAGLRDLRETVQRLSAQLGPVLSPISGIGPDSDTGSNGGPVPAAKAPLVDRIDALYMQLRQERVALYDLERRLAL